MRQEFRKCLKRGKIIRFPQGKRLVGKELDSARSDLWYKRHYPDDRPEPHFLLDWGLALFLARRFEESAARFGDVIFENPCLIPFALGRRPKTLPIWHSNNPMYRDYARE